MHKLGSIVGNDKSSFADLLESADVVVSNQDTIADMVEKYINELPENDNLKVLTAYFVEDENAQNFDGQIENENVYDNYNAMYDYYEFDDYSNSVGAIAEGVGALANLGSTALQGRQKKKYGLQDLASKKQDAKAQLVQAIVQQKQAEAEKQKQESESKAKRTKYWIIGGSVVGGLAVIGLIIYLVKKRNG